MSESANIDIEEGQTFYFRMMQEDQHIHWKQTSSALDAMLTRGILHVSHHRDRMARYCISVFLLKPSKKERRVIMKRIMEGRDLGQKFEQNIRLFPMCTRDSLSPAENIWSEQNFGCKL